MAGRAQARNGNGRGRGGGNGRRGGNGYGNGGNGRRRWVDYPRSDRAGFRRWIPSFLQVSTLFLMGFTGFLVLFGVAYSMADIPDPNKLVRAQTTIFYDRDGEEIARVGPRDRVALPLEKIPEQVRCAVLSAEHRSFYQDSGVSPKGMLRAVWTNVRGGSVRAGGSTITQQYVKNYYLSQDRTLKRKINEFFIALKIDKQMSKDQILEGYLNTIYFGRAAYGIESAAHAYFGKPVQDVSLSEAAALAAILRSPGYYDPHIDPANLGRLQDRWQYVIDGMVEMGCLSAGDAAAAELVEPTPPRQENRMGGYKGYLVEMAQDELLRRSDVTQEEIEAGGLRVHTTFDLDQVEAATKAVDEVLWSREGDEAIPDNVHAGLVAVEAETGEVIAIYGGRDFNKRQFNDAVDAKGIQAGSTFKPFALAAAFEQDPPIDLKSRFNGDSPRRFDEYTEPDDSGEEVVKPVPNFEDRDYGWRDLRYATAHSINTIFVDLGIRVGAENVMDAAVRAGIPEDTGDLTDDPSVVLGVATPRVVDLAGAYATFANEGVYNEPHVILEAEQPSGALIELEDVVTGERRFDEAVISNVTSALQGVIEDGSGRAVRRMDFDRPSAGKTGTTNDNKSALFTGYTPQIATAVAMYREEVEEDAEGNRKSALVPLYGIGGKERVNGGGFPAEIWTTFMKAAMNDMEEDEFPEPEKLEDSKVINKPTPKRTRTPTPSETAPDPEPTRTRTGRPTPTITNTDDPWPWPTETEPSPTPTVTEPPCFPRPLCDDDDPPPDEENNEP